MPAKETNPILCAALEYIDQGFSVIPVNPQTKRPYLSWAEFQKRIATEDEVYSWFDRWPTANIAIVTGSISNVFVFDGDGEIGSRWICENLPKTSAYVKTGRDYGCHCYYRLPTGVIVPSRNAFVPKVDLKAEGGYVVAPPSIHACGRAYEWIFREGLEGFRDLAQFNPAELRNKTGAGNLKLNLSGVSAKLLEGNVSTGSRNAVLASNVGQWIKDGLGVEAAIEKALSWNQGNTPPLGEKEVLSTVRSIFKTHLRNHPEADANQVILGDCTTIMEEGNTPAPYVSGPKSDCYPTEILQPGGLMQEVMDYIDATSAASLPLFNLAAAMTLIGALAGMKVQTETGLKTNLYSFSLGYSGTGKDAPNKAIPRLLQFSSAAPLLGPSEVASAAGFMKYVASSGRHVTVCSWDEIGMLLKGLQNPSSPISELPRILTKWFSSAGCPERKVYADDKLSFTVPWHHVSIYGSSTTQAFWGSMQESDTVNGFLARFLVFESQAEAPRPKFGLSSATPKKLIEKLAAIWQIQTPENPAKKDLGNLAGANDDIIPPLPHVIQKDEEAAAFFEPFAEKYFQLKNQNREKSAISSVYGRVAEHAHKLALIHAVSLHGDKIVGKRVGIESVAWAMKVAEACAEQTIIGMTDNICVDEFHAAEQKVVRFIKRSSTAERPGATSREIMKFCHLTGRGFKMTIDSLLQKGEVFSKPWTGKRGFYTTLFCVPLFDEE